MDRPLEWILYRDLVLGCALLAFCVGAGAGAPATLAAEPRQLAAAEKNWYVVEYVSTIDDSKTVLVSASAEKVEAENTYRFGRPELTIRCQKNATSISFSYSAFLSKRSPYVTTQLDQAEAVKGYWKISSDRRAFGHWRSRKSIPFIKQLLSASKLSVRVTPDDESPITATFDLAGLAEEIKPLREACHW